MGVLSSRESIVRKTESREVRKKIQVQVGKLDSKEVWKELISWRNNQIDYKVRLPRLQCKKIKTF